MTRQEKETLVAELSEKLAKTDYFYITDPSDMSAVEVNDFRKMCFEQGIEYKLFKNTLIRKALDTLDTDYDAFADEVLKGTSGVMIALGSGSASAKVLKEYKKKNPKAEKPLLKGASIDSDLFIGAEHLDMLSVLKSKKELIGDVIALLQSPATHVVSALKSGSNTLAGLIKTLSEKE